MVICTCYGVLADFRGSQTCCIPRGLHPLHEQCCAPYFRDLVKEFAVQVDQPVLRTLRKSTRVFRCRDQPFLVNETRCRTSPTRRLKTERGNTMLFRILDLFGFALQVIIGIVHLARQCMLGCDPMVASVLDKFLPRAFTCADACQSSSHLRQGVQFLTFGHSADVQRCHEQLQSQCTLCFPGQP